MILLFKEILVDGGPVMWLILACSVIATFIFLEKLFYLHRVQVNVGDLVRGLINVLKRGNIVEAVSLCDDTPGPAAHVLRSAILSYEQGEEDVARSIEDAALDEIPRLEARMNILATIAYIAPLLGLLGTVFGMIEVFNQIKEIGAFVNSKNLASGISKALYTTGGGLCVAIPCYIAYNYLVSRIEAITLDMEKAASEIVYFFKHSRPSGNSSTENLKSEE
ncbi:MAG TPA: biopolymer transporter ExbB [Lentisphaeria bacterium]|nr:MAG: biopolymer transporter ExbB [Lentisphaerae bacterium GWF2_49_21]HBC87207.1 biopolymer transporter ExbB [Lentisphaeria bacterium]